jgi:hypothetical protein
VTRSSRPLSATGLAVAPAVAFLAHLLSGLSLGGLAIAPAITFALLAEPILVFASEPLTGETARFPNQALGVYCLSPNVAEWNREPGRAPRPRFL